MRAQSSNPKKCHLKRVKENEDRLVSLSLFLACKILSLTTNPLQPPPQYSFLILPTLVEPGPPPAFSSVPADSSPSRSRVYDCCSCSPVFALVVCDPASRRRPTCLIRVDSFCFERGRGREFGRRGHRRRRGMDPGWGWALGTRGLERRFAVVGRWRWCGR